MTELDPAVRASIYEFAERYVRAYVDWDIYTNQCNNPWADYGTSRHALAEYRVVLAKGINLLNWVCTREEIAAGREGVFAAVKSRVSYDVEAAISVTNELYRIIYWSPLTADEMDKIRREFYAS